MSNTKKLETTTVIAALVKGKLCIIYDGTVRVYDPIAQHFVNHADNAPGLSAVKAAFTAGRTRKVYV